MPEAQAQEKVAAGRRYRSHARRNQGVPKTKQCVEKGDTVISAAQPGRRSRRRRQAREHRQRGPEDREDDPGGAARKRASPPPSPTPQPLHVLPSGDQLRLAVDLLQPPQPETPEPVPRFGLGEAEYLGGRPRPAVCASLWRRAPSHGSRAPAPPTPRHDAVPRAAPALRSCTGAGARRWPRLLSTLRRCAAGWSRSRVGSAASARPDSGRYRPPRRRRSRYCRRDRAGGRPPTARRRRESVLAR